MSVSPYKTWIAGEVLTASDLNASFTQITNNALSLISPLTGNLDFAGNSIVNSGTLTLPTTTDTLVGRVTTDTMSNKTFVAPALGAATATSINFGQTALNYYQEGTWTPIDSSGATLTFANVQATYTRIGRLLQAGFFLTFPSTANGSTCIIGGLPFGVPNTNASRQGSLSYTTSATAKYIVSLPTTSTFQPLSSAGATIANSAISTNDLNGNLIYPIS